VGEAIRYIGSVRCGDANAEVARFLVGEGRTQPFLEQGMTFARCHAQIPAPLGEVRIGRVCVLGILIINDNPLCPGLTIRRPQDSRNLLGEGTIVKLNACPSHPKGSAFGRG
jgi:hypothetical protein